jgi:hypothetical protein
MTQNEMSRRKGRTGKKLRRKEVGKLKRLGTF